MWAVVFQGGRVYATAVSSEAKFYALLSCISRACTVHTVDEFGDIDSPALSPCWFAGREWPIILTGG